MTRHARLLAAVLCAVVTAPALAEGAPTFAGYGLERGERSARVDRPFQLNVRAFDSAGEPFEVQAEGLPVGAKLVVRDPRPWSDGPGATPKDAPGRAREVFLSWTPTREQRGRHALALVATGAKGSERLELTINVEEEWESYFLPGVQYVGYFPAASDRLGRFNGAAFEFVLGSWVHQNEARGPSHGRLYVDLALLSSDAPGVQKAYAYTLGLDLSIERNPWRRWLIPVFGVEVGGLQQRDAGTLFTSTPFAGAHLYAARSLFVTVTGGYVFTGRHIEEYGGWRVRAGLNAALW